MYKNGLGVFDKKGREVISYFSKRNNVLYAGMHRQYVPKKMK